MSVFELQDVPRSYTSGNVLRLRRYHSRTVRVYIRCDAEREAPKGRRQARWRGTPPNVQSPGTRSPPARPLVLVTVWGTARHNCAIAAGKAPPAIPIPMLRKELRK